jgi:hypothetical protein
VNRFQDFSKRFDRTGRWARRLAAEFILVAIAPGMFCVATAQTAPLPDGPGWVATWGAAMMAASSGHAPDFTGQTLRQIVHVSDAGYQAMANAIDLSLFTKAADSQGAAQ